MPVRLSPPSAHALNAIPGVRLGVAEAHIRKANRRDLLLIELPENASIAAVFTQNRFCAAPVTVAKRHLTGGKAIRALIVNTGNANAGTGSEGEARALRSCEAVAKALGCDADQVLPFSTGVIMEPLPVERIEAGLPQCVSSLAEESWLDAAEAIMTTDIVAKAASRRVDVGGRTVTITGIAKGSGMIHPNMATMLGFMATDAHLSVQTADELLRDVVADTFNSITVDGDTSTNDALVLISAPPGEGPPLDDAEARVFRDALYEVALELAQAIVRDGEGATKFMTISVTGGRDRDECRAVAFSIAHSPLIKTAFFASDPNLGRILAAIGYAPIEALDVNAVTVHLGDLLVAANGGRSSGYDEGRAAQIMQAEEITVRVDLHRGEAAATVWTCDFSHDYVRINAEYRS